MTTESQFKKRINALLPQTSAAIKQAMADVAVHGHTWRTAAIANGVTESGIFRATQRVKAALARQPN